VRRRSGELRSMRIRCMVEDRCYFDGNGWVHGKMKAGTCDFD